MNSLNDLLDLPKNDIFETTVVWLLINSIESRQEMINRCKKFIDYFKDNVDKEIYIKYSNSKERTLKFVESQKFRKMWYKKEKDEDKKNRSESKLRERSIEKNIYNNSLLNFFVLMDFMIFISRKATPSNISQNRRKLYDFQSIMRGTRESDLNLELFYVPRNFYGITNYNILPYISPVSFIKPGTERCRFVNETSFQKSVNKHYTSLCGISGSSTLVFYLIYYMELINMEKSNKKEQPIFNENDSVWLIIFIWCCLCFEGGHSLIEVLGGYEGVCMYAYSKSYDILKDNIPFINVSKNFTTVHKIKNIKITKEKISELALRIDNLSEGNGYTDEDIYNNFARFKKTYLLNNNIELKNAYNYIIRSVDLYRYLDKDEFNAIYSKTFYTPSYQLT